ncbi:uncharacterized protein LOC117790435 [Drosophila innubila]|uniref:uncharacterized protein LOC117790435 n=1 Tax=Drosophila innubila TaxID=198719 RepID=UPI00148B898B|nr:uncharacterized protein LOC117790435 [Drosophila innubila]
MVKVNNGTKMMVNRCMELLNAKIANAQTRHIAKRVPVARLSPRNVDVHVLQRERQKCQEYEVSKRLSMWEQEKDQTNVLQDPERLDNSYYKHYGVNERSYDCTWVDFPERPRPKPQTTFLVEDHIPFNRRKSGQRPETAKPFDAEATDFLKQWDSHNTTVNRSRYSKNTNASPSAIERHFNDVKISRRQSHY